MTNHSLTNKNSITRLVAGHKNGHEIAQWEFTMKHKQGVFAGFAVLLLAAIFALTGCPEPDPGTGDSVLTGTITISPSSGVTTGTELTAVYSVAGETGLSYRWNKGGSAIAGTAAASQTYTPAEAGNYTVTVSKTGYQSKTSAPVTVSAASTPTLSGTIEIKKGSNVVTSANINEALTAVYTPAAAETGVTVSYQWNKDGASVAATAAYTPTTAGTYTVTVSAAGYTSKTSGNFIVNDPSAQTFTGTLKIQKGTPLIDASTATTGELLTATYSGSESDFTWQWKKGSTNVGSNSATYTPTEAGSYTVTISKASYNDLTSSNTVTVTTAGTPTLSGTITIKKAGAVVTSATVGETLTAEYTPAAGETGVTVSSVSYQWKKDSTSVATTANYTPTESGTYTVTVSAAGYNPKTSSNFTVDAPVVQDFDGTLTISPTGSVFTETQLTAAYTGTVTVFTYQWTKDGTTVTTGGTNQTYTPTAAGSYTVTISKSGYNDKTSDPVTVSAVPDLEGTITIKQGTPPAEITGSVNVGETLTAAYTGGSEDGLTYQWKKGDTNVGTNSTTYIPSSGGSYTVTVSKSGYSSKTSDPVTVAAGMYFHKVEGITSTYLKSIAFGGPAGNKKFLVLGPRRTTPLYSTNGASFVELSGAGVTDADNNNDYFGLMYLEQQSTSSFIAASDKSYLHTFDIGGDPIRVSSNMGFAMTMGGTEDGNWATAIISTGITGARLVAVGRNGKLARFSSTLQFRPNLASWTAITIPAGTTHLSGVAHGGPAGNKKFVVVGASGTIIYSSSENIANSNTTWTKVSPNTAVFGSSSISHVIYGGPAGQEKFFAHSNAKIAYSTDGIVWTEVDISHINMTTIRNIFYGGPAGRERFILVGYQQTGAVRTAKIAYSADGTTWTEATYPGSLEIFSAVTYGEGTDETNTPFKRFVVLGTRYDDTENYILYSDME
jgi:hypothetical protein